MPRLWDGGEMANKFARFMTGSLRRGVFTRENNALTLRTHIGETMALLDGATLLIYNESIESFVSYDFHVWDKH